MGVLSTIHACGEQATQDGIAHDQSRVDFRRETRNVTDLELAEIDTAATRSSSMVVEVERSVRKLQRRDVTTLWSSHTFKALSQLSRRGV